MNTYAKFAPNVFVAKCTEKQEKGNIILLETKYGKEHECLVFNYLGIKEGFYYHSIVRNDGYNHQEASRKKVERLNQWALSAQNKSDGYWEASKEGKDFLALAEPIKICHHSEKRHRALIERNHNRIGKAIEAQEKSNSYLDRISYWQEKSKTINLSMPESLEFYEYKLEQAKIKHEGLKNGITKREHSFSLTYANKDVKDCENNLKLAKRLWE
jgi:hypothetical protein